VPHRGSLYEIGTLRVVLLNPPAGDSKTVDQGAVGVDGAARNRAQLELSSPGLIQAPRIIDDDVPLFREHPVVSRRSLPSRSRLSKDLAITMKRGLYGTPAR